MRIRNMIGLAAISLAGFVQATMAQPIVIDSFSSIEDNFNPWPVMQTAVGSVEVHETDLTGVLGGVRRTTTTLTSVTAPGVDFMQTSIVPDVGVILDYAASAGADGELSLLYDGDGSLDADFSLQESILVEFATFDFAFGAPLPVMITLSDGTDSATLTQSLTAGGSATLTFAIASFAGIGSVDLSSITSVQVHLDPGTAADYRLTGITTVAIPTPGALALMIAAGLVTPRRRR